MSIWRYIQNLFGGAQPAYHHTRKYTYTRIQLSRNLPHQDKLRICRILINRIKYRDYFGNAMEAEFENVGAAGDHAEAMLQQDKDYLALLMGKYINYWWK